MSGSEMEAKDREPEQGQGPVMIPKDCKRLAEVDFPIAEVSRHAAREKSIRHGHPSTLHLWWARRPAERATRPAQVRAGARPGLPATRQRLLRALPEGQRRKAAIDAMLLAVPR